MRQAGPLYKTWTNLEPWMNLRTPEECNARRVELAAQRSALATCQLRLDALTHSERRLVMNCAWSLQTGKAMSTPQADWLKDIAHRAL